MIRARRREAFAEVERALYLIPELEHHPVKAQPVIAPILKLVADEGFDLTTQIIPSIRRQAASAINPIKGWSYFVAGIRQDAETPVIAQGAPNGPQRRGRLSASEKLNAAFDRVDEFLVSGDKGPRD